MEWPAPTDTSSLRTFYGLCSYYRRFIPNFGGLTASMTDLLKTGTKFEWTQECQNSFDRLKYLLTNAPILKMPAYNEPFILDTDASNKAIGAVLSQWDEAKQCERVVCYASKKLSPAEQNYCTTRRELYAVVYFLKYFRCYVLNGHPIKLRTDHAALLWLKHMKEPTGQYARWIEVLEEFPDLGISHRSGRTHGNADAMSRKPETEMDVVRRPCGRPSCCKRKAAVSDTESNAADTSLSTDILRDNTINRDVDALHRY